MYHIYFEYLDCGAFANNVDPDQIGSVCMGEAWLL